MHVDVEDCDEQAAFDADLQNMTRFHPRWGASVSEDEAPVVSFESEQDVVKEGRSVSATWTFRPLSSLRLMGPEFDPPPPAVEPSENQMTEDLLLVPDSVSTEEAAAATCDDPVQEFDDCEDGALTAITERP